MSRTKRREIGVVHPVSDANKLLWERYYGPMQSAAANLNAAIINTQNLIGRIIMEREGFDPDKHVFNADKLCIIGRGDKIEIQNSRNAVGNNGKVD